MAQVESTTMKKLYLCIRRRDISMHISVALKSLTLFKISNTCNSDIDYIYTSYLVLSTLHLVTNQSTSKNTD